MLICLKDVIAVDIKQRRFICMSIFFLAEAAVIALAAGWFRQLGPQGIARAINAEENRHHSLPPGFGVKPAVWPARLRRVARAEAAAGWRQYTIGRRMILFGHPVTLPRAVNRLSLWGHITPNASLVLTLKFHGGGRSGAFSIPIRMQRADNVLQLRKKYFTGEFLIPLPTKRIVGAPAIYGSPAPGDLTVSWMHRMRGLSAPQPLSSLRIVKSFRAFVPQWAKSVVIGWATPKTKQSILPTGFTASSANRDTVISASWDWANRGRIKVEPYMHDSYAKARQILLRAGCPPWQLSRVVRRGITLLRGNSTEDILRLSLGIPPLHWHPQTRAEARIAMVVASSLHAGSLNARSVSTVFYLRRPGRRLYYCTMPAVKFKGQPVVEGQNFYVFAHSGALRVGGYVVTPKNISGYRGIGLAAGALNFFAKRSDSNGGNQRSNPRR